MKFFSDLGSCYRPTAPPPEESTQMPLPCNTRHKRNKLTGSKSENWRPDLSVISEDGTVSVLERKVQSQKKLPVTARPTSTKVRSYNFNDDRFECSRKNSMPVIIPAFSPTPFMF